MPTTVIVLECGVDPIDPIDCTSDYVFILHSLSDLMTSNHERKSKDRYPLHNESIDKQRVLTCMSAPSKCMQLCQLLA